MSEQEEIKLSKRILESISNAQRKMIERKIKLGEPVIIADSDGMPVKITAEEALLLYFNGKDKT